MRKVGAPRGGWVQWLLWHLPADFKGTYLYYFETSKQGGSYARHNYVFYRMQGRKLYDIFIVVQTSRHYWHITYTNIPLKKYEYFGYRNTRILAEYMVEKWRETQAQGDSPNYS